jgi:3-methyl-2-oxobutanoate hydroxymethyltransferase
MSGKMTLADLRTLKGQHSPISMLTCYDYATAVLLQQAQIHSILVGDTAAQMVLGHSTTLPVSMDVMITLSASVRRGAPDVFLLGDMPFLSYQVSTEQALLNAGRFLAEAGCDAVKLEVTCYHLGLVEALTEAGIPVFAHLGLRPQAVHQMGTFKAKGQTAEQGRQIVLDGLDMVNAGACGILLECVTTEVAKALTEKTDVPVISCGSGPDCDGQVMVLHDILGLPGSGEARFAKKYADIGEQIRQAVCRYAEEIHQRSFPDSDHSYHIKAKEKESFVKMTKEI